MENEKICEIFERFFKEQPVMAVLSGQIVKSDFLKLKLRPVRSGDRVLYQAEEFRGKQAFHKNMNGEEAAAYLSGLMGAAFKQAQLETVTWSGTVLAGKKGNVSVKVRKKDGGAALGAGAGVAGAKASGAGVMGAGAAGGGAAGAGVTGVGAARAGALGTGRQALGAGTLGAAALNEAWKSGLAHNRKKNYILEEGVTVPFLVDLGVQTKEGKIINSRYDKFRQINRFLEFIEDILPKLDKSRESVILDFGCGKSYLTFAMYYYLKKLKGYPVRIIGLDLKDDVIKKCNSLAEKYGYANLRFFTGDIASYEGVDHVDMVVTLHACDTATDFALEKAVRWGAKVILSVPCCQHELNGQMENQLMKPVLQYGIIKERMAALYTDALRAQILENFGYRVQILEFIDMEHTPKNLLIRAVRQGNRHDNRKALEAIMQELHVEPTLWRLLCGEEEKNQK